MLKQRIMAAIIRHIVSGAGVGGVVGIEDDLTRLAGGVVFVLGLAWSVYEKIRDHRTNGSK